MSELGNLWAEIARRINGRTGTDCHKRWENSLRPDLVRGPWSAKVLIHINSYATKSKSLLYYLLFQEDAKLIKRVNCYGDKDWVSVSRRLPGRTCKMCRQRWISVVNPAIDHSEWRPEEDEILIEVTTC